MNDRLRHFLICIAAGVLTALLLIGLTHLSEG